MENAEKSKSLGVIRVNRTSQLFSSMNECVNASKDSDMLFDKGNKQNNTNPTNGRQA